MLAHIFFGTIISGCILVPLTVKWELDKRLTLPVIIPIGLISGLVTGFLDQARGTPYFVIFIINTLLISGISVMLLAFRFYRDPERVVPQKGDLILAPADGKIIYIKEFEDAEIPFSKKKGRKFSLHDFTQSNILPNRGILIGISMSYLDVHVNRAPIQGNVRYMRHIKGRFISLKSEGAILENERMLLVFQDKDRQIGVVQIASRLVRKIVSYIKIEQPVGLGERIGMIKFGSQVDVIIPHNPGVELKIVLYQKVKAGQTILATYKKQV